MSSIVLTAQGRQILTENTLNGGQEYWLGYYGLAYVPDNSKFTPDTTTLVGAGESGDYIYNIWQGDIVGSGNAMAAMGKVSLYDHNLVSNYRYSYDSGKRCNRLVTWSTDSSSAGTTDAEQVSYIRTGYRVYEGIVLDPETSGLEMESNGVLPVPAPLFYLGHGRTYGDRLDKEGLVAEVGGDWPMTPGGTPYPKVTPDMRAYSGNLEWQEESTSFDEMPTQADDPYGVIGSGSTRYRQGVTGNLEFLDQYAKFVSVSNFNKAHGTVSSEGYGVNGQESCHNMSRVTRLFPIASYHVTASGEPETVDGNVTERGNATAIKYSVDLDLSAANQAMQVCREMLTYEAPAGETEYRDLYESRLGNSFKFNRIGFYAVPVTIRHFYAEGDGNGDCRSTHYQVEISPDANPVLVAVARTEEICMSEDSTFGQNRFKMDFILNIADAENSGLCTDANVYYNLDEDDAITWYQNQLLASAGLSEAVTSLQIDMAHMMNRMSDNSAHGESSYVGERTDSSSKYGLKNLVDECRLDGSVRGVSSSPDSASKMSFTLGVDNSTFGEYCLHLGNRSDIDSTGKNLLFIGGSRTDSVAAARTGVTGSTDSVIVGAAGEVNSVTGSLLISESGESFSAGANRSILVGAGKLNTVSAMTDSAVNARGTEIAEDSETVTYHYPSEFRNVIWHGSLVALGKLSSEYSGSAEYHAELQETPLNDILVFGTPADSQNADRWIGRDSALRTVYNTIAESGYITSSRPSDILQPYCAPMIFTGGIALGGHYVQGGEPLQDAYYQCGQYGLLKLGIGYFYGNTAASEEDLHRNTRSPVVCIAGSNLLVRGHDLSGGNVDPIKMIGSVVGGNTEHYVVHSPHAMKPLISTEYQELDGTLHIGLGQNPIHCDDGTIGIDASYIAVGDSGKIRLTIRSGLDVTGNSRYINADSAYIDTEALSGTISVREPVSGIGIKVNYTTTTRDSDKYLVLSDTTLFLPSDRARTYVVDIQSLTGAGTGHVEEDVSATPSIKMEACEYLDNSNMHLYVKSMMVATGKVPKLTIPALQWDGGARTGFICSEQEVTIRKEVLYRFSAVSYMTSRMTPALCTTYKGYAGSNKTSYPVRVEAISTDSSGNLDVSL